MGNWKDALDEEFAESWQPNDGDVIAGIVEGVSHRDGTWGKYPIVTIQVVTGEPGSEALTDQRVAVHGAATALKGQIEDQNPQRGDFFVCRSDGKRENEKGVPYYKYTSRTFKGDAVPEGLQGAKPAPKPQSTYLDNAEGESVQDPF